MNDPAVKLRFRLVAKYPLMVTCAYNGDIRAAAKDDDATVAARVREWEISQGIEPRDWVAIVREQRRGDPDEERSSRTSQCNRPPSFRLYPPSPHPGVDPGVGCEKA
jgi:hypothetical protein